MTSHELAHLLLKGPDLLVTVSGYEGGVDEVITVGKPTPIHLKVHNRWYYGAHEYHSKDYCPACGASNAYDPDAPQSTPSTFAIHLG